jgi:hypothetical protein
VQFFYWWLSGLAGVAIPAVNRLVATRLKRDFRLFAALGAGCGVHLAGAAIPVATATTSRTLGSFGTSTGRAALWFIGEAFGSKEFLFFNCERKRFAAIATGEGFFRVSH